MGVVKTRAVFQPHVWVPQDVWGSQETKSVHLPSLTWLGALIHRAIVDLVDEVGAVVVHVDDIDIQIDRILHLVAVHVHRMGSELRSNRYVRAGSHIQGYDW